MGSKSAAKAQAEAPSAAALLRAHVNTALVNKAKGTDGSKYTELLRTITDYKKRVERDSSDEAACHYLAELVRAVTGNVSVVKERRHETLVAEILGIKIWSSPKIVQEAVLEFVSHLVVANTAFIHACLQLLVYSLTPPPAPPSEGAEHGPWQPSERDLGIQLTVLNALNRVLSLVPTAPTNMLPLLVQQMPHKLRDRSAQCAYLTALFAIAEGQPGAPIREALLTAVVEHLLTIDVEIKWEDIVDVPTGEEEEEVEGEQEEDAEDIFELEGMSELDINATPEELRARHAAAAAARGGWEGAASAAAAAAADGVACGSGRPAVDETANKLDSMMELTFAHLTRRIEAGHLPQVWDTLMGAFERTLLNTHRSKFTQFLLFYTATHSPEKCATSFTNVLLARLRDTRQPPITRTACAAYLASFLARAAFCPTQVVVSALTQLAGFCLEYTSSSSPPNGMTRTGSGVINGSGSRGNLQDLGSTYSADGGLGSPGSAAQRHPVLYASVQAILYVLCYHLQPIVAAGRTVAPAGASPPTAHHHHRNSELAQALETLVRDQVWLLLKCKLAPLEVCLPSVVSEFAHQVSSLGLLDCTPLLPKAGPTGQRAQRALEMFFPFDPYLLKRSSRALQLKTCFVTWRHGHPRSALAVHATEDEEEEEEEAREEEDDLSEDHQHSDDDQGTSSSSSSDDDDDEDEGAHDSLPSDGMLPDRSKRFATASSMKHMLGPAGGGVSGGGVNGHHPSGARAMGKPPLSGGGAKPPSGTKRTHSHALAQRAAVGAHHQHQPGHGHPSGSELQSESLPDEHLMGTSYMSYASGGTSHGDMGTSPYGSSPYDGSMLVANPLGSSPGAVPMSLGTPTGNYMHSVPMRIAAMNARR